MTDPSAPDTKPLIRLARQVRTRALFKSGARRALESLPAALQITVAAVAAYAIARWVFGHPAPLIAVTVTITSLGLARDARPRRVLETALGVTVGIALSEGIVLLLGKGPWQLAIIVFATLVVARAVSAQPAFAIAAAVQSVLVVLVPDPEGGPFTRSLDAVIAGVVALLATALFPRNPRRATLADARAVFSVLRESGDGLVDALTHGSVAAAELALERLRRAEGLVEDWKTSLDSAIAIARISPWLRRQLPDFRRQEEVLNAADLASRHFRTVARRVIVIVRDGSQHPDLAGLIAELSNAVQLLSTELEDRAQHRRRPIGAGGCRRAPRPDGLRAVREPARVARRRPHPPDGRRPPRRDGHGSRARPRDAAADAIGPCGQLAPPIRSSRYFALGGVALPPPLLLDVKRSPRPSRSSFR